MDFQCLDQCLRINLLLILLREEQQGVHLPPVCSATLIHHRELLPSHLQRVRLALDRVPRTHRKDWVLLSLEPDLLER